MIACWHTEHNCVTRECISEGYIDVSSSLNLRLLKSVYLNTLFKNSHKKISEHQSEVPAVTHATRIITK